MNETPNTSSQTSSTSKILLTSFWIASILLTGFLAYGYGKGSVKTQTNANEKVLSAQSIQSGGVQGPITGSDNTAAQSPSLPASDSTVSSAPVNTTSCAKTGFAQKWEYLTPYVLKQGDSLQSIATDQLKDSSRVNELLQLNGVGPLVAGSTLYLPPASITKSSGKLQQVYGKLVEKTDASWHISFTSDKKGQGILIPSFLFQTVANKDTIQIGSCVTVFLDDGYKVYSLSLQ